MAATPVIALVDGEHHPSAVRDALDALEPERGVAGVVFCGGEEKVGLGVLAAAEEHYGRAVESGAEPGEALRRVAAARPEARVVVDLADEPVVDPPARMRLASLALHLGLDYEAPGMRLTAPRYEAVAFPGPRLAVIGTGKRAGKTAVSGHWAALLRERGRRPVIVAMGRGGPREPALAEAETSLDGLLGVVAGGGHGASDFLEDAVLAGVPTVGSRRVGGGPAGEPFESSVGEAVRRAAVLDADILLVEGSGACVPPVEVDRTVCVVGDRAGALEALGPYRLLRADLALVPARGEGLAAEVAALVPDGRVVSFELFPEPAEPVPPTARVALFSTGAEGCRGVEPVVSSRNLARRGALGADLKRARAERCDVYLTELKAAAIDTVAARAREEGARVIFVRNRPVGIDADLDEALMELAADA